MHQRNNGWITDKNGTWQQFAMGRITREDFPMGGYIYFAKRYDGKELYTGNSYANAFQAMADANLKAKA